MFLFKRDWKIGSVVFAGIILLIFFCLTVLCLIMAILANKQVTRDLIKSIDARGLYFSEQIERNLSQKYEISENIADIISSFIDNKSENFEDIKNIVDVYNKNLKSKDADCRVRLNAELFQKTSLQPYVDSDRIDGEYLLYPARELSPEGALAFRDDTCEECKLTAGMKPAISDPHVFDGVYQITISSPIILNNEIIGCAGVDISITEINRMINSIVIEKDGHARLISNNFIVVANGQNIDRVGESLITDKKIHKVFSKINNGEIVFELFYNKVSGNKNYLLSLPVEISDSGIYWMLEIVVPERSVREEVLKPIIGVLEAAVLLLVFACCVAAFLSLVVGREVKLISRKYESVLDSIENPVMIFDKKKRIIFKNNSAGDNQDYMSILSEFRAAHMGKNKQHGARAEKKTYEDSKGTQWQVSLQVINDFSEGHLAEAILFTDKSFELHVQRITKTLKILLSAINSDEKSSLKKIEQVMLRLEDKISNIDSLDIVGNFYPGELEKRKDPYKELLEAKVESAESVVDGIRELSVKLNMLKLSMSVWSEAAVPADIDALTDRIESIEKFSGKILNEFLVFNDDIHEFLKNEHKTQLILVKEVNLLKLELEYLKNIENDIRSLTMKNLKDFEHIGYELEQMQRISESGE